jgi:glucan biosynthesis protein C
MAENERLHALDSVRGFALMAGVLLHSAMSFLPGFAKSGIPITDNSPSVTLGVLFFVIHMFRMTLFFVIAGFFGRMLLQRDGIRRFLWNRAWRILLPLVVFWFVTFPPILAAAIWGAIKLYGEDEIPMPVPRDGADWLRFPLMHLWFLYVLVLLYCAAVVCRVLLNQVLDRNERWRQWADRCLASLLRGPFATPLLAAPTCISLCLSPLWFPWFGIPTPDQSLIPERSAAIAFSTAFFLGWMLERQRGLIQHWQQSWGIQLGIALTATVICLSLTGAAPYYSPITDPWRNGGYAVAYTIGVWSWTFALFGIALRTGSGHDPRRRYLADASYWIYLMHMPLVFVLQVALMDAPLHWTLKFPIIFGATMLVLLFSYHWLVRPTWIGQWLNGRRYPRPASPGVASEGLSGQSSA